MGRHQEFQVGDRVKDFTRKPHCGTVVAVKYDPRFEGPPGFMNRIFVDWDSSRCHLRKWMHFREITKEKEVSHKVIPGNGGNVKVLPASGRLCKAAYVYYQSPNQETLTDLIAAANIYGKERDNQQAVPPTN